MSVAAAVLAAGRGSRLGGDASKPLLVWRGRPLVTWAVDAALASGLAPVVVIVGYRGDEVRAALSPFSRTSQSSRTDVGVNSEMIGVDLGVDLGVEVVENPDWDEGIASSLRAVLTTLAPRPDLDAVCVGLADQPRVSAEAYRRVAATAGELVIPTYDGHPGNPVKLARSLWREALALRGDVGARALARDRAVRIDCTGTGSAADVDTLEDLERLQQEDQ
ncbi:MAG TPA: nucleotidyltransferase family protein [Acidimicrobiia bacterium]|nr:nucleotidyltransferase family protein [Acidimicrobiia bacterium]